MSYEYTQTISLDSRFRDNINSSTSTDFTITLPEIIRNVNNHTTHISKVYSIYAEENKFSFK